MIETIDLGGGGGGHTPSAPEIFDLVAGLITVATKLEMYSLLGVAAGQRVRVADENKTFRYLGDVGGDEVAGVLVTTNYPSIDKYAGVYIKTEEGRYANSENEVILSGTNPGGIEEWQIRAIGGSIGLRPLYLPPYETKEYPWGCIWSTEGLIVLEKNPIASEANWEVVANFPETIFDLSDRPYTPAVVTPPVDAVVPVSVAGMTGWGITVSAQEIERVSDGTTTEVATLDRVENVTSGGSRHFDFQLAVTRLGEQSDVVTFSSSAPTVGSVDAAGLVTMVSAGKTTIRVTHGPVRVHVPIRFKSEILATTTRIYEAGVPDSARAAAETAVDLRLAGKSAATALRIFTTQNHGAGTYVRNASCWAADLDLTCISPWNSTGGATRAGVAITARHIIFAKHYQIGTGATVRFVAADGTVVDRVMTAKKSLADTDLTVGLLDFDLPASISPCSFLPANWRDFFPTGLEFLPALCLDKEEKALVTDCDRHSSRLQMRVPCDATRLEFYEPKITGDSGNPAFLIIGDVLMLLTTWWFGGAGSGPFVPAWRTQIESAITELGANGQSTADVSLAGFTDFSS